MNNYVTLDGKRYKTPSVSWKPRTVIPKTPRLFLNGTLSVTYGQATLLYWDGEFEGPVTATAPYGTIDDLRTSLRKRQLLTFVDHYGDSKNVMVDGDMQEISLSAKWDGASNIVFVKATLMTV